jgi:hypothetical protein
MLIPPIEKKCKTCKKTKLLNFFDINVRSKDKHKNTCQECDQQKEQKSTRCMCACTDCENNKIVQIAGDSIELLLNRLNDHQLSPDILSENFKTLIADLALTVFEDDDDESDIPG